VTLADQRPIRVLFVCTGNSCRSIMAEALLRDIGGPSFEVHSAGTHPKGLNERSLRTLAEAGMDASWARSKSVDEFAGQDFDDVITVCDRARQVCPVFPGAAQTLHWDYEDPADATGTDEEIMAVYRRVFAGLQSQIRAFVQTADRRPDATFTGPGPT
jgi:arsenate reductase (thioredoxin)